jgi:hypothetical protein
MATINHNGKEYEYDPHAVRVAVDCKVCWYSPIVSENSAPEKPVYKGMVVYDGIEKQIKFHPRQPSLDWDAHEGDNWWQSGLDGGFMEFLTQSFLPLSKYDGNYDLDCTIPIDDELDSKCVLKPIIDWTEVHNLVYVPPGTTEVTDPYWKVQESNGDDGWSINALPPIFDFYFSEYKFTCPGWDEDDTLRVIDVLFQPLCDRYLSNEELFENQPYEGEFEEEHIAGWLDLLYDMPKASIRILQLLHIEAFRSGLGSDMNMMVEIINITTPHLQSMFPELYAEYLGPVAKEGRYCHWGHSMRKPTPEEHESLTNDFDELHRVCGECETDFSWNAEGEDGYWHCFDCHRNAEPEYDNHICHNCGMEQGVLNLLRAVQASETEN